MNELQKRAWYNLSVIVLLFGYASIRIAIEGGFAKEPLEVILVVFMAYSIGASAGTQQRIFSRKKTGKIFFDERDRFINYRAVMITFLFLWLSLFIMFLFPWSNIWPNGLVPELVVQMLPAGMCAVFLIVYSMAVLIQYGRGGKNGRN